MKRRMKLKSTLGKISRFLRAAMGRTNNTQSVFRRSARGTGRYPSSTKLGASSEVPTATRRNIHKIAHKKNHHKGKRQIVVHYAKDMS